MKGAEKQTLATSSRVKVLSCLDMVIGDKKEEIKLYEADSGLLPLSGAMHVISGFTCFCAPSDLRDLEELSI